MGPPGGGVWAPGPCPRAWPDSRVVMAVNAGQRSKQSDGACGRVLGKGALQSSQRTVVTAIVFLHLL